jgi:hypothetical protein
MSRAENMLSSSQQRLFDVNASLIGHGQFLGNTQFSTRGTVHV